MKIYAETYGCTMNQGDTEMMLGRLEKAGNEIVENIEESDIIIVNTCAVKRTTLNRVIYRLKELNEEKDKSVIVAGCLPLIEIEKIEEIGEFAGIVSCLTVDKIINVVNRISNGETNIKEIEGKSEKPLGSRYRKSDISAPIPIAEGCTSNCSYCCVKFARGKLRSFEQKKIISQVKEELKEGRKEIYITTQDTAAYGLDLRNNKNLSKLLDKITNIPGDFRVRVGMMNPKNAKNILPELLKSYENEKIYTFLHAPIQSGNDRILEEMGRGYTVEDFKGIVNSFEDKFTNLHLVTDIIVGFPGETKEEFQDSCKLLKQTKPDKVNLTRFTPMPGTKAREMKQIESEEKKRRSKKMTSLLKDISLEKNQKYVGKVDKGLVIKEGKKGGYEARLNNYKPVIIEDVKPGEFAKIKITKAEPTYLEGEVIG